MKKQLNILIDADAFVATIKKDDSNHNKAISLKEKLKKDYLVNFYVSSFSIPETSTVLSKKVGQNVAKEFVRISNSENFIEIEFIEPFRKKTDSWFNNQSKKGTSYFDCANMVIMDVFEIDAIFSFDKVYKQNGFKLLEDVL